VVFKSCSCDALNTGSSKHLDKGQMESQSTCSPHAAGFWFGASLEFGLVYWIDFIVNTVQHYHCFYLSNSLQNLLSFVLLNFRVP
jgi:hypothetical protein